MVDYSKWDRMDFSDSDDGEDESSGPRITSLEEPGKVTIDPNGSLEIEKSSLPPAQPRTQSLASSLQSTTQGIIPTVSGSISGDTVDISSRTTWRNQLTHNGGEHHCTVTANEKEIKLPVYWSQDKYTATLRLAFPPTIFPTRGIRVRVKGALKYSDRFSAVGSGVMCGSKAESDGEPSYGTVEVISISNQHQKETILLEGKLPRPVHLNQDEDDIDFEIEDNLVECDDGEYICNKLVAIIMPKAVPMSGMVLWWDCPLLGYPKIDVSTIQERNSSRQTKGKGGDTTRQNKDEKKEAFQKAWDEAHKMFREKVKTREKQSISIDE